jgi:hypothetical protein
MSRVETDFPALCWCLYLKPPSVCLSPLQFKLGEMQNFALLGAESGCEVSHAACENGVGVSLTPGCTVHHVR